MKIVAARVRLHLPMANSLKSKRQVIRSIVGQVRNRFDLAVAEVAAQDLWQISEIGLACVTSDARHGEEVIARAVDFISTLKLGDAELLDYETEVLDLF